MSRLVFGRDRIPDAWEPEPRPECAPGHHLIDDGIRRCTVCLWLDPDIRRCETQGCILPGEYEAEVGEGPGFTTILRSAVFCRRHAFLGGIALVPDERVQ